ncbi:hypothetical protein [Haliangium ochraceum]|uniref:hypothetical protein n=1 Tax=Haliangium ochraceum TaxID=80816 RepID=UPI00019B9ACD|nr:hypothetical protein [Haliangium ochraceum]
MLVGCALLVGCASAAGPEARPDAGAPNMVDADLGSAPFAVPLYLRGSFNDFAADLEMRYVGNNRYVADVALSVGQHEFKVADAGFSDETTFSLAGDRVAEVPEGAPVALQAAPGVGNNMLLAAERTGLYRFELSATDRSAPVLLVSLREIAPYRNPMLLRGTFGGLARDVPLGFEGEGRYATTEALEAGTHAFKVTDLGFSDDATFVLDPEGDALRVGTTVLLIAGTRGEPDLELTLEQAGSYRFELQVVVNPATPLLTVTAAIPR